MSRDVSVSSSHVFQSDRSNPPVQMRNKRHFAHDKESADEVLQILQQRSSQRASLGAILPVEQKACNYLLEQHPNSPTRDQVQAFSKAVKGFELNRTNRLQLINLAPTNLLELLLAVDNCEARFSSTQMEELLALVNSCGRALDQSSEYSNLKKGHGLDLPLWLATDVAARHMVNVRLPKCYGKKMREKMRAGPGCEDLRVRSPYFYSVAMGLQPHLYSNDTLAPFVIKSFRDRYQELLSKAHTSDTGVEATRVQSLICVEEQCLFEAGRVSMKATEDWRYKVSSRPARAGVKRRLDATDTAH